MRQKLQSEIGKQKYKKRKITVEPVFGNLKYNLGFKEFSLRGHNKVRGEFNLMSIAHNLKKIYNYRLNQSIETRIKLALIRAFIIYWQIYIMSVSKNQYFGRSSFRTACQVRWLSFNLAGLSSWLISALLGTHVINPPYALYYI